ncbi:MAG: tail fiber domain-containing protein [Lewinellaceae bacterium]|nr:tail fiber domain-containing protein [Saprospiraceae bacterium]MCB9342014.1 tail fiber domain-containing protein [Lewinellaceae bacterium]
MKKNVCFPLLLCLLATSLFSQSNIQQPLSVNSDGASPAASAILDVQATDKGMLVPRMTTAQRTAIASPATGLLVFDNSTGGFWFYNGTAWVELSSPIALADADNDTKIQVEGSPDEDILRFDAAGSERLSISADSNVFTGFTKVNDGGLLLQGSTGGTPVSGPGVRLMWIPAQKAFRAGSVSGDEWDDANIGEYSAVVGGGANLASGLASFIAGGVSNTASGSYSFACGSSNTSSGYQSFTIGGANFATGSRSFACGTGHTASGIRSFIGGGANHIASGGFSFIGGGADNTASGSYSFIGGGHQLLARSYGEVVFGTFNSDYVPLSETDFNAADRLFVIGNGATQGSRKNAVTVLKNGNFGIRTNEPEEALHVNGNIIVNRKLQADDATGLQLATDEGTSRVFLKDDGWVGINTSAPNALLHVNGDLIVDHRIQADDAAGLELATDEGTSRVFLNDNGNVGIGIATANAALHVNGDIIANKKLQAADAAGLELATDDGTSRVFLQDDGKVGIGTSNPDRNLEISSGASTTVRVTTTSIFTTSDPVLQFLDTGGSGFEHRDWEIRPSGGDLEIRLSENNFSTTVLPLLYDYDASATNRNLSLDGALLPMIDDFYDLGSLSLRWDDVYATNGVINTSDAREKENILDLGYGLAEIMQLRPVSFTWKNKNGQGTKLGLIAQEVQPVISEVVVAGNPGHVDETGSLQGQTDRFGIYYSDLIPVLIRGMQEQQVEIEKLKVHASKLEIENRRFTSVNSEIGQLKAENVALKTQLDKITAALASMGVELR